MIGFIVNDFVVGDGDINASVIETSDYAYSFNRQFWDQNVGGMGGDLMEIVRRLIPNRRKDVEWVNPIRNTMPDWLPGNEYFTDFKVGDPYTKIAKGEMRLPGEGYERLHNVKLDMKLGIGSSYLGKSQSDIVKHFLKEDVVSDPGLQDILETGTEMHEKIEKDLVAKGVAVDVEGKVEDKQNQIIGYYDVLMRDPSSSSGMAVMDIKTVGNKAFQDIKKTQKIKKAHQIQVNFYLNRLNLNDSNGYITYVNRDNPEEDVLTLGFQYDDKMNQDAIKNLQSARKVVQTAFDKGEIGTGAFYGHLDRYRILADVAPYSKEFKEQKKIISAITLSEEEKLEVKAINERVSKQKESLRLYPYRFKTSNVEKEKVTVKRVIDSETFLTKEYPNNPIRLAGINANSKPNEEGKTVYDVYHKFLKPGQKVQIAYDEDIMNKYANDTYDTIRASVTSKGRNLNRYLVNEGFARENEEDFSPAAVHARFNGLERTFGSMWESVSHLNTPFHTKMLQTRSAYESYVLREVYGKDFQNWAHPIRDFLIPTIHVNVERHPMAGVFWGTVIGAMFGSNRYGRTVGAVIGGTSVGALQMAVKGKEAVTGEKWIPKVRQEERDLEEYVDRLTYIKNRRLYEEYRKRAFTTEFTDVEAFIKEEKKSGDIRKRYSYSVAAKKKKLKLSGKDDEETKAEIDELNDTLNSIQSRRKVRKFGTNATKAIYYYQQSEKTMYGYDPGEPLTNILAALPKKDRQYMKFFLDAPEEERQKILKVVPDYLKRILQASWGYKVDDREDLETYFSQHYLPDENWMGWEESTNLDDVRVKLIKKANLDFSEFDVWEDDIDSANRAGKIPIPKMEYRQSSAVTRQRLKQLLGKNGMRDVQIKSSYAAGNSGISMNLTQDVRPEVRQKLEARLRDE